MRFAPLSATATRVDISLTYRPLRTQLGEALRALMTSSNASRLRSELANVPQELENAVEAGQ